MVLSFARGSLGVPSRGGPGAVGRYGGPLARLCPGIPLWDAPGSPWGPPLAVAAAAAAAGCTKAETILETDAATMLGCCKIDLDWEIVQNACAQTGS